MNTDTTKDITSAADWVHSMPVSPNAAERIYRQGMKNRNCLDVASMDALTVYPMVWVSILHIVTHPRSGKVRHCQRRVLTPISITSGSSLNAATRFGANTTPSAAKIISAMRDDLTQKLTPFLTLSYFFAPKLKPHTGWNPCP